jgi:hypothetical protein
VCCNNSAITQDDYPEFVLPQLSQRSFLALFFRGGLLGFHLDVQLGAQQVWNYNAAGISAWTVNAHQEACSLSSACRMGWNAMCSSLKVDSNLCALVICSAMEENFSSTTSSVLVPAIYNLRKRREEHTYIVWRDTVLAPEHEQTWAQLPVVQGAATAHLPTGVFADLHLKRCDHPANPTTRKPETHAGGTAKPGRTSSLFQLINPRPKLGNGALLIATGVVRLALHHTKAEVALAVVAKVALGGTSKLPKPHVQVEVRIRCQ